VARGRFSRDARVERYSHRTPQFDKIIPRPRPFLGPLDKKYIDFSEPFDLENKTIMPLDSSRSSRRASRQDDRKSKKSTSPMRRPAGRYRHLHGEQARRALGIALPHPEGPGAQDTRHQTREEARHSPAFSAYIRPVGGSPALRRDTEKTCSHENRRRAGGLQEDCRHADVGRRPSDGVPFATLYQKSQDPLLVKLCQLVMTDEASITNSGRSGATAPIPKLTARNTTSSRTGRKCFQTLLFNLVNSEQMQTVYAKYRIEWQDARAAIMEAYTDDHRRESMKQSANISVSHQDLLNAGIITSAHGLYGC